MRSVFGRWLLETAKKDPSVVLLVGDNGYATFLPFQREFPNRYFNVGICEQSMVGVAAGMAMEGLHPYVFTITSFLLERAFEQIKLDVDAQNVNVKLVGYGSYAAEGVTHTTLDTARMVSLLPNTYGCFPSTEQELLDALDVSYLGAVPAFISLQRLT